MKDKYKVSCHCSFVCFTKGIRWYGLLDIKKRKEYVTEVKKNIHFIIVVL
jgi:hypothetical protein